MENLEHHWKRFKNYLELNYANNSQFSHFTCKTHTLFLLVSHSCGPEISETSKCVRSNRGLVAKCWCTSWLQLPLPLPALSAQVAFAPASRRGTSSEVIMVQQQRGRTGLSWELHVGWVTLSTGLWRFGWCDINVPTVSLLNCITGRWTGLICLEYFIMCFKETQSLLSSCSRSLSVVPLKCWQWFSCHKTYIRNLVCRMWQRKELWTLHIFTVTTCFFFLSQLRSWFSLGFFCGYLANKTRYCKMYFLEINSCITAVKTVNTTKKEILLSKKENITKLVR